jgi:small subunit ribosomal protein S8
MYIDLLTKLKNAQKAKKESLKVPFTTMDFAIAEILAARGFVGSVSKKGRAPKRVIDIDLKYDGSKGAISGINFLSVPSRRLYVGYQELRPVKQGFGVSLISTPKGILTNKEARKAKVGGQLLFEIW